MITYHLGKLTCSKQISEQRLAYLQLQVIYYQALCDRDKDYEGVFLACIKTTGIFCRSSCRARKPKMKNVEFVATSQEALRKGYRPCKLCMPMLPLNEPPVWIKMILNLIEQDHTLRLSDQQIQAMSIDPNRVRRWFKKNHRMTFQAYLRALRLGKAFGHLTQGGTVIDTAFKHGYESLSGFTRAFKQFTGESPKFADKQVLLQSYQIDTPLGPMLAASVNNQLCLLEFTDRRMLEKQFISLQKHIKAPVLTQKSQVIEDTQIQLNEYFSGQRQQFDLALQMIGSPFQKSIWRMLQSIAYGHTKTYKQQAQLIDHPKAVRAVANANGANKISIIIPCHRVIGSDGTLTGYGGGIERKRQLLQLEDAIHVDEGLELFPDS